MNFISFSVLPRKVAIYKLFYISKYVHTRSRKCEDGLESQCLLCVKNHLTYQSFEVTPRHGILDEGGAKIASGWGFEVED